MGKSEVRKCTIADIEHAPNIEELLAEYAEVSAIPGLPPPQAQFPIYSAMESSGLLHIFGAFRGSTLVGFVTVISSILPHYGVKVATTESFFVAKEYRSSYAGLNLLRMAEQFAQETGSAGLLISAPTGSALAALLPKVGYNNTNLVFFRSFTNG